MTPEDADLVRRLKRWASSELPQHLIVAGLRAAKAIERLSDEKEDIEAARDSAFQEGYAAAARGWLVTVTPDDTNLVRRLRDYTWSHQVECDAADAIERLSAEKEAAEADAERLAVAIQRHRDPGADEACTAALAAHDARRGQS